MRMVKPGSLQAMVLPALRLASVRNVTDALLLVMVVQLASAQDRNGIKLA
jgi:hypothetical protein